MKQLRRNPVLRSIRVLAKVLATLAPVGAALAALVGVVVWAFTTFATLAYVDAKDGERRAEIAANKAEREAAIGRLMSAIDRIDQRTWEAWGKPRGEPEPPRAEQYKPSGKGK